MDFQREVAKALVEIGAVGFSPAEPVTFKSGIVSPVYVDNRRFPFYPRQWRTVIGGFGALIKQQALDCDVIAGVEAAGIPHSAALGFRLEQPSVFVRKQPKDHGLKKRVEGGDVAGKRVLLVEDLVSTGMSSLSVIEALRQEHATVADELVIITYGMKEAQEAFAKAGVQLYALTNFEAVLEEAITAKKISAEEKELIQDWLSDPHGWAGRHGF